MKHEREKSVWRFSPPKAKPAGKRQGFFFASLVIVRKFKIDLLLFWSLYWNSIFHEISKHKFNSRHPSLMGIPVMGKAALSTNMAPVLTTLGWGSWVGSRILYDLKLSHAILVSTLLTSQRSQRELHRRSMSSEEFSRPPPSPHHYEVLFPNSTECLEI